MQLCDLFLANNSLNQRKFWIFMEVLLLGGDKGGANLKEPGQERHKEIIY